MDGHEGDGDGEDREGVLVILMMNSPGKLLEKVV